jgi:CRP/FNR family transcriptional regulator, cyclic AMP receptor protein
MKTDTVTITLPAIPGDSILSTPEADKTLAQPLYTLIAEQPFFKGLTAAHLQLLTDSAFERRFEKGQMIFHEGSPANRFFVILEGKVALESEVKERGTVVIQTLGPGEDLGWSWLFPPHFLHFGARAVEPTRTIFFFGTRLREQCEQDHELGYQLMIRIAEVTSRRIQAMQQRLMECTDPEKFQQ